MIKRSRWKPVISRRWSNKPKIDDNSTISIFLRLNYSRNRSDSDITVSCWFYMWILIPSVSYGCKVENKHRYASPVVSLRNRCLRTEKQCSWYKTVPKLTIMQYAIFMLINDDYFSPFGAVLTIELGSCWAWRLRLPGTWLTFTSLLTLWQLSGLHDYLILTIYEWYITCCHPFWSDPLIRDHFWSISCLQSGFDCHGPDGPSMPYIWANKPNNAQIFSKIKWNHSRCLCVGGIKHPYQAGGLWSSTILG
jgi:hypothetical protein